MPEQGFGKVQDEREPKYPVDSWVDQARQLYEKWASRRRRRQGWPYLQLTEHEDFEIQTMSMRYYIYRLLRDSGLPVTLRTSTEEGWIRIYWYGEEKNAFDEAQE